MVVWHVTIEIILVVIYLLEDEQELSLGMLIRPKCIYNFCLLLASFGDTTICFDALSYHLQHILDYPTNSVLSASFCLFCSCIAEKHEKFQKKYQKNPQQKTPEARRGPRGATPWPGGSLERPEGWSRHLAAWARGLP